MSDHPLYAQVHCPEALTGAALDDYLARGWFRMAQNIFTTNFLNFKDHFYSALWLRVSLDQYTPDRQELRIFKRNAQFTIQFAKATITPEKEDLFTRYKQSVPFEPSSSLYTLLMGKSASNIFDTIEVTVRDGEHLIAVGFFDMGEKSAAGITSIYDPLYKKYSLGKLLIYLKMEFCKKQKLQYFYPGYFVPGYSFFDYKLSIGTPALQFLNVALNQWQPYEKFSAEKTPLSIMRQRLTELQQSFEGTPVTGNILQYEYFDANLVPELIGANLFDAPVFMLCQDDGSGNIPPIIYFDVRDEKYHLVKCFTVWSPISSRDKPAFYDSHLLKVGQELFATDIAEMITTVLHSMMRFTAT